MQLPVTLFGGVTAADDHRGHGPRPAPRRLAEIDRRDRRARGAGGWRPPPPPAPARPSDVALVRIGPPRRPSTAVGSPATDRQSRHRMRTPRGAQALVVTHAHEPVQVVPAVRSPVRPASVQRAEHPLLLANEQSHPRLPSLWSRILLDLRPMVQAPHYLSNPHSTRLKRPPVDGSPAADIINHALRGMSTRRRIRRATASGAARGRGWRRATSAPVAGETPVGSSRLSVRSTSPVATINCPSAPGGNRTRGLRLESAHGGRADSGTLRVEGGQC